MIRCAEAPLAASIIASSSISESFGRHPLGARWRPSTGRGRRRRRGSTPCSGSRPRRRRRCAGRPGRGRRRACRRSCAASSIEARPPKTIRRFVYSAGIELIACGLSSRMLTPRLPRPRRPSPLSLRVALDVSLLVGRDPESAVGDVLSDHRTGASVSAVADGDRGDQRGVDARFAHLPRSSCGACRGRRSWR